MSVERWVTTDDHGTHRYAVIEYDRNGIATVTREFMRDLLTRAGMRLSMDAEEAK